MLDLIVQERLSISGEAGKLDAELCYPAAGDPSHAVVLFNPHPHMGGTMENNVIRSLAMSLPLRNAITLRFDYRGTGASEGDRANIEQSMAEFWRTGHAPEDAGMIEDARMVLDWCWSKLGLPIGVVGYSFGAYAAVKVAGELDIPKALISPTLCQHPFTSQSIHGTLLMIYSNNDFATPLQMTQEWLADLPPETRSLCIDSGEHFFRNQEDRISEACSAFFGSAMADREAACLR